MKLTFTVPGKPVPKARARMGKGKRWYTPLTTVRYERAVRAMASCALDMASIRAPKTRWPTNARYVVAIDVHFPDARRRDVDNVAKSVLDACNPKKGCYGVRVPILWRDDSQVTALTVTRNIDRANPRTEVTVEVLT